MTFHQSSAAMLIVAAVIVAGYHFGHRRPSDRRSAPPTHVARPHSWASAAGFLTVLVLVLAALFTAAFTAAS